MKRDFWDMSFNPVWGCLTECSFCYARKKARQFAEMIALKEMKYHHKDFTIYNQNFNRILYNKYLSLKSDLKNFQPTWLESNYQRKFPKKPSIIFVNSMSDPVYWEQEWYEKIVKRIAENMQHTFVVLTKQPKVYEKYTFPHNTILGVTCTTQLQVNQFDCDLSNWWDVNNRILISIEPIQEEIKLSLFLRKVISWIHIGQESGNRKNRVRATREMIEPFFDLDMPVFMKNNLTGIVPGRELRKEFP